MTDLWVVNASPLIILGKAEQLDLLPKLADELIVPHAVSGEVSVRKNEAPVIDFLRSSSRFRIEPDHEPINSAIQ